MLELILDAVEADSRTWHDNRAAREDALACGRPQAYADQDRKEAPCTTR